MQRVRIPQQMQSIAQRLRSKGRTVGFVPTMGALHDGHLSLIRAARAENAVVVVSIFVNPAQFGPKEDFSRYPRPLKNDLMLLRREGVDYVFIPSPQHIYPPEFRTYITVEELSDTLCGATRPGHFRGVATIVAKLFNLILPVRAYFGQKDAQQVAVIKRMVGDLSIPVTIRVLPTVRTEEGLALSSRNTYLDRRQATDALILSTALREAARRIKEGERDPRKIARLLTTLIIQNKQLRLNYAAVVDADTLEPVTTVQGRVLIALAAWLGKTRLIDNTIVTVHGKRVMVS